MHSARSLVAAALMLLASNIPARAQDNGHPIWGVLGLGKGPGNIACNGCPSGWNLHGETLLSTVGVMITPQLGIGVGLDEWWRLPSDTEVTALLTVLLHYYPSVRAGAFVEAGVGYSRAEVALDGGNRARATGVRLMAAVGYDLRLTRGKHADLIVTPRVSYVYSSLGDLRYDAGGAPFATGWQHQVLSLGLGVGVYGH